MKKIFNLFILIVLVSSVFANDGIHFDESESYDSVVMQAKSQGKLVFLDFTASWCIPCKKMDRETFSNASLGKFINGNFIPFKVKGDFFWGMDIAEQYNVSVYPTLLVIDGNGNVVKRITGFQTAEGLLNELRPLAGN